MNSVYVIGHRQPDTDSICSVIGYAELLNMDGGRGRARMSAGVQLGATSHQPARVTL